MKRRPSNELQWKPARCEHQCQQQWTEIATDEYIQIMCCVLFLLCCFCCEECCFCFFFHWFCPTWCITFCITYYWIACTNAGDFPPLGSYTSYAQRSSININYISIKYKLYQNRWHHKTCFALAEEDGERARTPRGATCQALRTQAWRTPMKGMHKAIATKGLLTSKWLLSFNSFLT